MESSRKRNVHMASGEDGVVDQAADNSFWQIESGPAKRVAGSSAQSAPSMYLSLISNQLQTQNTATTQSSNIPKRPQPGNINMNSQKPCSQYTAPQQNPFLSIGGDSAMNSNGSSSPRTFVSGGGCPAPFPGQWDNSSWLMHQAQQQAQAFFPFMLSGGRGGYPFPMPSPTPGSQRGSVKVPPGLSQKHCQLWENQSSENVQIWSAITQMSASLARAEAEIACQRARIIQLESALQSFMNQETVIHCEDIPEPPKAPVVSQMPKKERGKRSSQSGPVAIVCLPASQPAPLRQRGRKPKARFGKVDHVGSQQDTVPGNEHVQSEVICANQQVTEQNLPPNILQPSPSGTSRDKVKSPSHQNTHKELVKVKEENVDEESEHEKSRIDIQNSLVIYNAPPDPAKDCSALALKESSTKDEIVATNCCAIVKVETDVEPSHSHQDAKECIPTITTVSNPWSNDAMRDAVGSSKVTPQWQFGVNGAEQSNNGGILVEKDTMDSSKWKFGTNDADQSNTGSTLAEKDTVDNSKWQFKTNDAVQCNNGVSLVEKVSMDSSKWHFSTVGADTVLVPGRSNNDASAVGNANVKIETDGEASHYNQNGREYIPAQHVISNNLLGSFLQSQSSNNAVRNDVGSLNATPQWPFRINNGAVQSNNGASLVQKDTMDNGKWQFGTNGEDTVLGPDQINDRSSVVENATINNGRLQIGTNGASILHLGQSGNGASLVGKDSVDNSKMANFFPINSTPAFPKEVPSIMWRM